MMDDLLELLELVEGGFGVWNHMPLGQALQDVKSHDIPTP